MSEQLSKFDPALPRSVRSRSARGYAHRLAFIEQEAHGAGLTFISEHYVDSLHRVGSPASLIGRWQLQSWFYVPSRSTSAVPSCVVNERSPASFSAILCCSSTS